MESKTGWKGILAGKEDCGDCGIGWQSPWAQILTPGSLGPFFSIPLTTKHPQDKPCPRRTVPLRLRGAGPAVYFELTLLCSALFLSSKFQVQTGSELLLQENTGLPGLGGCSRPTPGPPVGVRPLWGTWLRGWGNKISASACIAEWCATEGGSQTQSKFIELTRSSMSHRQASFSPWRGPQNKRLLHTQ